MPRIAYQSRTADEFYARLDRMMDIAARSLKVKREVITKLLDGGLYPYTKRYLGTFENHFSTIGLVGMNEAGLNARWIGKDMTHPETQEFTKNVLNHMRERLSEYQVQYGDLYNLEATPAESTSYRLAKHDVKRFPGIKTASGDCGSPYYTNSSHLPVGYTSDVFDALDVQDELQTLYTSGTVFHAFLGEKLPDWKAAAKPVSYTHLLRVVLWVAGCNHNCRECHNPVTWDIRGGIPFDQAAKEELFVQLEKPYVTGITLSGGDPLHPSNREDIGKLISEIYEKYPHKTIWLYTGYDLSLIHI